MTPAATSPELRWLRRDGNNYFPPESEEMEETERTG
jgi:hypothetical protein